MVAAIRCALTLGLMLLLNHSEAQAQTAPKQLTVASWGGKLDATFKKLAAGFEAQYGVTIKWVPGNSTENAAKVRATRGSAEYDLVMTDDVGLVALSKAGGVIVPIDRKIVSNYADLRPEATFPSADGVTVGFNVLGAFYNEAEFQKRGWPAPTNWTDLFRPEFCHMVGLMHPNVSYTTNLLFVLAGGDVAKVPDSIATLGKLRSCVATLESSAAKLEEKIGLGEYLVGVNGSVRVLPLKVDGFPLRFIVPKEGTSLISTAAAVVRGGQENLSQQLLNWIIAPASQRILMEDAFYVPANKQVDIPQNLIELGMPSADIFRRVIPLDRNAIIDRRRDWVRQMERAFAH